MPRVTVITPAFNAVSTLPECLASVAAQEFGDWEHLVVDDGSTDGTRRVAEAAAVVDRRVRLLTHPETVNRGRSASRNLALRWARGELLAFLDADDMLLPGALATYVEAFGKNPAAGVVYGQAVTFGSGLPSTRGRGLPDGPVRMLAQLARFDPLITSATAVRGSALAVDPFPPARFAVEDWMFLLELSRRVAFLFVGRLLARYRLNPAGGTEEARRAGQLPLYEIECAEYLREVLGYGSVDERRALDAGLRFRATSALQLAAAALRRGRIAECRRWSVAAWRIAESPARFMRALVAVPSQQLTVWRGREHPLTLSLLE